MRADIMMGVLLTGLIACADNGSGDDSTGSSAGTTGTVTGPASGTTAGAGGAGGASGATAGTNTGSGGVSGGAPGTAGASGAASASPCPMARPSEGASCQAHTSLCTYDEIECRCPSGTWTCMEPVDPTCPAMMPAHASPCASVEGTECDYQNNMECDCLSGAWSCEQEDVPDAGTIADSGPPDPGCPQGRPAEDTACTPGNMTCQYEDTSCMCPSGATWQCNEPVDPGCPEVAPTAGSPCTGAADCDFLELECECAGGMWGCKPND
jgi:hypothetical protein